VNYTWPFIIGLVTGVIVFIQGGVGVEGVFRGITTFIIFFLITAVIVRASRRKPPEPPTNRP
jgi:uncharacterized membrane protein